MKWINEDLLEGLNSHQREIVEYFDDLRTKQDFEDYSVDRLTLSYMMCVPPEEISTDLISFDIDVNDDEALNLSYIVEDIVIRIKKNIED